MRIEAPAKINLHLRVGPPTADGFHPLVSWMVTVGLFDTLELSLTSQPGIALSCDEASIPADSSNLIHKVASALLQTVSTPESAGPGLKAALQKRIPVGAGLGGGSSDAAFTLMALNRLLGLEWSSQQLSELAARFGSDLSFFMFGPSSICTGRGEIVRAIAPPAPRAALLLMPAIHMPTPAVYRKFDEMGLGSAQTISQPPRFEEWVGLPALRLLPLLVNDLEAPAFAIRPELGQLREHAEQCVGRIVRMSGSGSTLFTLFDTLDEAAASVADVEREMKIRVKAVPLCPAF